VAYFWLSFGIEAFKTGVSQADVSIMYGRVKQFQVISPVNFVSCYSLQLTVRGGIHLRLKLKLELRDCFANE
jgi:hypothetical protein